MDQAPRFSYDPSGILLQQDSAWLSVNSNGQASTTNKSYGEVTTRLQHEEQPALVWPQSSRYSQDYAGAVGQSSAAGYQQSFTPGEGPRQAVMAPVFLQDPGGVRGNVHRPTYLTVGADQVPISCQSLSRVADQFNCSDYHEASTQGIVSSTNLPISDQFGHMSYLAASLEPSLEHPATFVQNSDGVYS